MLVCMRHRITGFGNWNFGAKKSDVEIMKTNPLQLSLDPHE